MMSERDLQELAEFASETSPVLSLYLNVDPHRRSADEHKLSLRRLLTLAADQGAEAADLERIERFFSHEHNRQGQGAACFSGHASQFWRAIPLLVPVDDFVHVGSRFYLRPLSELWDEYDRFGVISVDREGARGFIYHLGALVDSAGTLGAEVKRHKQGGWAAQRLQRREDEEAKHNLRDAAEWAEAYLRRHKVRRVVLAGSEDNLAKFRELLARPLLDKVVGQVTLDMNASPADVWEKSYAVARQASEQAEALLLEEIITQAHKGGNGVMGWADTLSALQEKRIHHLVVSRVAHAEGRQCEACQAIVIDPIEHCPYCQGNLRPTADIVNLAVQRAVEAGIKVSFVQRSPELASAGGAAALLRY